MKEKYEEPVVEVIVIEGDVITDSCNAGGTSELEEMNLNIG